MENQQIHRKRKVYGLLNHWNNFDDENMNVWESHTNVTVYPDNRMGSGLTRVKQRDTANLILFLIYFCHHCRLPTKKK